MSKNRPLIHASNKELDIQLNVIEGSIPKDWYGTVYLNSPCGTVNSNGLPYPDGSAELGSPIMNGDGYVYRIDLGDDRVRLKTAIMKPFCYYADLATKLGNTNGYGKLYQFKNDGLTRMSLDLGSRDELNTAITPFQFKDDAAPRMLACYDAGRNWEINVEDLSMVTPIGANEEYTFSTPPQLFPFPVIQSTAHPSFDPLTREMFLVNFTKSLHTMTDHEAIVELLKKDFKGVETFLEKMVDSLGDHTDHHKIGEEITKWLSKSHLEEMEQKAAKWIHGLFHRHKNRKSTPVKASTEAEGGDTTADNIYLLRWTGEQGPLDKWQVVDEHGEPLKIIQCMHQTAISEDYIILADATFKFAFDLMINAPFKSDRINAWLRKQLTTAQEPYLDIYLVERKNLDPNSPTVTSKKLTEPIPLESVHFTADYRNPDGKITLHLAHNSAACLAEWVRTFDKKAPDGKHPVNPEVIGLISTGCMDIGRIGKVVIDGPSATIVSQEYIVEPGNLDDVDKVGAHTWGVGLYTFRDIISPNKVVDQIRHNYWSSFGMSPDLLTKFIYDLYSDYPNAIYTPKQVLDITNKGIPFVLSRQNVATMKQEDFYQFDKNVRLYSVQFVPRKPGSDPVSKDEQKDGYIFTSEVVNYPNEQGNNYRCEMWIFKAWDLASGPCCKLTHPDLDYAFTLHSAWVEEVKAPDNYTYKVDTRKDYDPLIKGLLPSLRVKPIQDLFEKHIYPHFD